MSFLKCRDNFTLTCDHFFQKLLLFSSQDNYQVNKDAEKGKENTAFDKEESKRNGTEKAQQSQQQNGSSTQQTDTGVKNWESNYVPFGDYPKGNIVYVKEVN